ncbi:hypothetical protein Ccrd_002702 [Cynara cardunculus var. scolymus]|uniref:Uncharacterized protein n=1 Tax=Cynara cardunculus var. scolymus TaxID=59895 RepID=A0A103XR11_CYNCS|nr:hypothetical protein Ccrd_002702 [Cynara cardunculus var. scolymus]
MGESESVPVADDDDEEVEEEERDNHGGNDTRRLLGEDDSLMKKVVEEEERDNHGGNDTRRLLGEDDSLMKKLHEMNRNSEVASDSIKRSRWFDFVHPSNAVYVWPFRSLTCFTHETILKITIQHYMDNRPQSEEALVERAREYLIAISDCVPESNSCLIEPEIPKGENNIAFENKVEKVVDELRSKLISIASHVPSMDCADNKNNGNDNGEV